jgi:ferredoxin
MSQTERRIGDLTVRIDRDTCISSGNCVKVAPELFELDEESIVTFARTAAETARAQVLEACEVCPVEALTVTDSSGKRLIP